MELVPIPIPIPFLTKHTTNGIQIPNPSSDANQTHKGMKIKFQFH